MLSNPYLLFGILILVAIPDLFVAIKVFGIYNSPEGERMLRTRMQGPFVPVRKYEMEEDERRAKRKQP